jgi:NhaC family Na+:H+ antiporter
MKTRKPTMAESIVALMILVVVIFFGYMMFRLRVEVLMIISAVGAGIMAHRLGYTWNDMEEAISKKLAKATPAILIIWIIGIVVASLMFSGSIPMLIYYGIKMVNPKIVIISAFFTCMVFSTVTGSSWASAGTAGVAFIGIAASLGVRLDITAAAIICGATFGDKLSPLSETTNLAPACAGANLYDHIRSMMWTTLPATVIAFIVFMIAGNNLTIEATVLPESAVEMLDSLSAMFSWNILLILPFLIILAGSLTKKPPVPTILLASFTAIAIGVWYQGFSLTDGVYGALNGFRITMVNTPGFDAGAVPKTVMTLLNRGGIKSMVGVVVIIYCGYAYASIITMAGFLETAIRPLALSIKNRGSLMALTLTTEFLLLLFSGNSYTGTIIVPEMYKRMFLKFGMPPKTLSRTLEDVGTIMAPLVPWGSSGAFYVATLGVGIFGAGGYAPWLVTAYATPIIAMILAITGIGIYKMNNEQIEYELEKYDAEFKVS